MYIVAFAILVVDGGSTSTGTYIVTYRSNSAVATVDFFSNHKLWNAT